jgi:hypothetical protein
MLNRVGSENHAHTFWNDLLLERFKNMSLNPNAVETRRQNMRLQNVCHITRAVNNSIRPVICRN